MVVIKLVIWMSPDIHVVQRSQQIVLLPWNPETI